MDSSVVIREALVNAIHEECRAQGFNRVPQRVMNSILDAHASSGDQAVASVQKYFSEHKQYQRLLAKKRAERESMFVTGLRTKSGLLVDVRKVTVEPLPGRYPQSDDDHMTLCQGDEFLGGIDAAADLCERLQYLKNALEYIKSGRNIWIIGEILKNKNGRNIVPVIFWKEVIHHEAKLEFEEDGNPGEQYGRPSGKYVAKLNKTDFSKPAWRMEYLPFTP